MRGCGRASVIPSERSESRDLHLVFHAETRTTTGERGEQLSGSSSTHRLTGHIIHDFKIL